MGLLDKVKNLFTEEVEEEVVVKPKREIKLPTREPKTEVKREVKPVREVEKEVRRVEIAPARRENRILEDEVKPEINISDSTAINKEEKFVFPVYFSDDDFKDLEKPKEEKKEEPKIKDLREAYKGRKEEVKTQHKTFKPSPIISPVYGVLDENYKKEDITVKEPISTNYYRSDKVTVDDIRNKAYGTLEDELENNLFNDSVILKEEKLDSVDDIEIDIFDELEKQEAKENKKVDLLREDYLTETEEDENDLSRELEIQKRKIEEINEIIKNNIIEKEKPKNLDNILNELDEIEDELSDSKIGYEDETTEEIDDNIDEEIEEQDDLNEEVENSYNDEEIENNNEDDNLVESDLFNLIDSMYEKRDEE